MEFPMVPEEAGVHYLLYQVPSTPSSIQCKHRITCGVHVEHLVTVLVPGDAKVCTPVCEGNFYSPLPSV
mgnify:CR=1 FL=1